MDADEKLTALKKAYADIILNMSKEAAGRVMASERKAVQYQHELKVTKDEALRMLMRLKQMMDTKINEAEAKSLTQQKKIELLEAQLEEAEDIVKDLREELSVVYDELEKVKNVNSQLVNEADNAFLRPLPVENQICSYQSNTFLPPKSQDDSALASDVAMPYPSQTNECSKCHKKIVCSCSSFIGIRDLTKIIFSGKEPGLYRKGCTQRIHACERNLLDRELCLSGKTDEMKAERNGRAPEDGSDDACRAPAPAVKTLNELENKHLAAGKDDSFNSFLQKRRRASRQRKTITPLNGKKSDVFLKLDQLPDLSASNNLVLVKDHHSSENPLKLASELPPGKAEAQMLGCSVSSEKESNLVEICEAKTVNEDKETESVLPSKETGVAECSMPLVCKREVEKVDVPSSSSPDPTEGPPGQPKMERVIKITFQRKRKRQAFSGCDVNASLGTEKKTRDKQNGDRELEQPKSSMAMEPTRHSRRLAQVARQLISLSERKW